MTEMPPDCELPFLAMVHWSGAENQHPTATALFSVADAGRRRGLEEELKNKVLCPTARGWILVHDPAAAATYLLDAQSRQKIQLPRLPAAMDQSLIPYCSCLLPGEPTAAGGCPVLVAEPGAAFLWYCRVGDGDGGWTRHEYDIGSVGDKHLVQKTLITPIAACRGRFYFNAAPTETRVLELRPGAEPEFSSMATEVADADRYARAMVFMVAAGEDLYKVVVLHQGGSFDQAKVFRMDFSHNRWRLVDHLAGRAFFVAPNYFGASCVPVAGGGIRRDCVYSLVGAAMNSFRIFNLKDGTSQVGSLEPYEAVVETVGESRPYWVLPTTQPRA